MEKNIEENYEQIVASGKKTFADIAEQAEREQSRELAAWARSRAAAAGVDVTPHDQHGETKSYADHTVPELKDLAKDRGITAESGWVKQSYVDALEAADAAGAEEKKSIDDQLRELLTARSLSTEGERPELLARLLEADDVDDDKLRGFLESQNLSTEGEHDDLVARILEAAAEQSE